MAVGLSQARGDGIAVYSLETLAGTRQETQAAAPPMEAAAGPADMLPARMANKGTLLTARDELGYAFALPVALVLLAVAVAALFVRRRPMSTVQLSDGERLRMLRELQEWLAPRSSGSLR